jgi:hypothetical protein
MTAAWLALRGSRCYCSSSKTPLDKARAYSVKNVDEGKL